MSIFNYLFFYFLFFIFFRQLKKSYFNTFVIYSCCNNLSINRINIVFLNKIISRSTSFVVKFIYNIIVFVFYIVIVNQFKVLLNI